MATIDGGRSSDDARRLRRRRLRRGPPAATDDAGDVRVEEGGCDEFVDVVIATDVVQSRNIDDDGRRRRRLSTSTIRRAMGLFIPLFIMAVRSTQGMGWTADCHPVILGAFRYYLPEGFLSVTPPLQIVQTGRVKKQHLGWYFWPTTVRNF